MSCVPGMTIYVNAGAVRGGRSGRTASRTSGPLSVTLAVVASEGMLEVVQLRSAFCLAPGLSSLTSATLVVLGLPWLCGHLG